MRLGFRPGLLVAMQDLWQDPSRSMAALVRARTAFQREAEIVLYDTLTIYASRDNSLSCMKTLATNLEKASLVRFLTEIRPRKDRQELESDDLSVVIVIEDQY